MDLKCHGKFFKLWFVFVATLSLATLAGTGWVAYKLVSYVTGGGLAHDFKGFPTPPPQQEMFPEK